MAESLDNKISRILSSCVLAAAVTFSHPAYADEASSGYRAADPAKGPCPEYICGPPQQPPQPSSPQPLPAPQPTPQYVQPTPYQENTSSTKNKENDTLGYVLMAAGAGLTALVLIPYAMADGCPDGYQPLEGDKCSKHLTERGWTALGLGMTGFVLGLYLALE